MSKCYARTINYIFTYKLQKVISIMRKKRPRIMCKTIFSKREKYFHFQQKGDGGQMISDCETGNPPEGWESEGQFGNWELENERIS
jgi:hypothetical protein